MLVGPLGLDHADRRVQRRRCTSSRISRRCRAAHAAAGGGGGGGRTTCSAAGLDVWVYRGADWFIRDAGAPHVAREQRDGAVRAHGDRRSRGVLDGAVKIVGVSDDHALVARAEAELRQRVGRRTCRRRARSPTTSTSPTPTRTREWWSRLSTRAAGIPLEEIATIGDMPNDVLMFGVGGAGHRHGQRQPRGSACRPVRHHLERGRGLRQRGRGFVLGGEPRSPAGDAGAPRPDARLPVRPRRRAHADREAPRRRVEADVRRLPARARRGRGEPFVPFDAATTTTRYVDGKLAHRRRARVPRLARHRAAGGDGRSADA